MPFVWTSEALSKKSTEEIRTVRDHALKKEAHDVVALCDSELEKRNPPKKPKPEKTAVNRAGQYVCEFHFVCPGELGVIRDADGTLWTTTWVVAEAHAELALKHGAIVALHAKRAEASYLQGKIINWRKAPRERQYGADQPVQIEEGIDFQFAPLNDAMAWKGDATGEKGYQWCAIPE